MAKKEYLEIMRYGVDEWNEWRLENRDQEIDLSEANLIGRNLGGYYLWKCNFSQAKLDKANLYRADFFRANLSQASVINANIREADFRKADLSNANLSQADLRNADLSFANLTSANFQEANLENTLLAYTIFGNTNLRNAKKLTTCAHRFPSIIDQMTLIKSGNLPESFLRGCGLTNDFINSVPSLFWHTEGEDYFSCFISYSHQDKAFALKLYDSLQEHGIRCWLDEKQLKPGDDIHEKIDEGIRIWDKVLLCCSKSSLQESWWVNDEIEKAFEKERQLFKDGKRKINVLIPLNLDNYFIEHWNSPKKTLVQSRFAADFTNWEKDNIKFDSAIRSVIKALRTDGNLHQLLPNPKL